MQTIRLDKLLCCFCLILLASLGLADERAKSYMLRSLKANPSRNVEAILRQRDPFGGTFMTVKIQRSSSGKSRDTILAPLKSQGRESIDDGEKLTTFVPDQKTVIIQTSLKKLGESKAREALLLRNYELESEVGEKIAGRSTIIVTACPKNDGINSIRYAFDRESGFPLRRETIDEDDRSTIDFEVSSISFPKSFDEETFKMKTVGGVEIMRYESVNLELTSDVTVSQSYGTVLKNLGFEPALAPKLPFGFKSLSCSVNNSSSWKSAVVRISDGLFKANVYQWIFEEDEKLQSGENRTVIGKGKIRVMVVGELSESVRKKLANAFLNELSMLNAEQAK